MVHGQVAKLDPEVKSGYKQKVRVEIRGEKFIRLTELLEREWDGQNRDDEIIHIVFRAQLQFMTNFMLRKYDFFDDAVFEGLAPLRRDDIAVASYVYLTER